MASGSAFLSGLLLPAGHGTGGAVLRTAAGIGEVPALRLVLDQPGGLNMYSMLTQLGVIPAPQAG